MGLIDGCRGWVVVAVSGRLLRCGRPGPRARIAVAEALEERLDLAGIIDRVCPMRHRAVEEVVDTMHALRAIAGPSCWSVTRTRSRTPTSPRYSTPTSRSSRPWPP